MLYSKESLIKSYDKAKLLNDTYEKVNNQLRQQNAELLEALKEAKSTLEFHLSKSQPQQYCDQSDFFNSTANSISNIESLINKYTQS